MAVQCHLHIDFDENNINGFVKSLINVINSPDENDYLASLSPLDFTGIDIFKYDKNNNNPKWESFFETDRSHLKIYSLDNIETSDIEKKTSYTTLKTIQTFKMKGIYMPDFGKKILETCISNSKEEALKNIPQNLDEAVKEVISGTKPEMIEKIKNISEKDMCMFHFGSGMSIRNKWGLWKKESPLCQYFNTIGIFHADDMSGIIMGSVWRKIHNQPLELDRQVKHYRDYWQVHQPSVNEGSL